MRRYALALFFLQFFCLSLLARQNTERAREESPEREKDSYLALGKYITGFCESKSGRPFLRIQKGILVDCVTNKALWKIELAENWSDALTQALEYKIYDNYTGPEKLAPDVGVALVQKSKDDYKYTVRLKQIIQFYKLPVYLEAIEDYWDSVDKDEKNDDKSNYINDRLFEGIKIKLGK